ncbi:hypothetical protein [Rickettsiella endosymbiont of Litargus connexus]|jgi:hypothetical protein|uniref:hypothetical protein n=1 Tax=Rickettsiella endosymbiont of Litargus connexus TaxID=3066237 RepID=UPI00376EDCD0
MKKNTAGRIKTFENKETKFPVHSPENLLETQEQEKKKKAQVAGAPTPKPRRTKKFLPAEQTEYTNVPLSKAEAGAYSLYKSHHPYDDSTQDYYSNASYVGSEKSEYENLLLQEVTDDTCAYIDPEGFSLTLPKKQPGYSPYDDSQPSEYYPERQSVDSEKSEYANLLLVDETNDVRIYLDPEKNCMVIPKKKIGHESLEASSSRKDASPSCVDPINTQKKQTKKSAMIPKTDKVYYTELDLTPSNQHLFALNPSFINQKKLETKYQLDSYDQLAPVQKQQKKNQRSRSGKPIETVSSLMRNPVVKKKKNRRKANYPGSLSTAFRNLEISTIHEEAVASGIQQDHEETRPGFFSKNKEKSAESNTPSSQSISDFPFRKANK